MRLRLRKPEAPGSGGGTEAWLTPGRFAIVLLALIVFAFPDVVTGARSFAIRDFGSFGHPLAFYHRECFWQGTLPLWNPWSYCGLPFLAQWNTLALYPPSLVYLLMPLPWSLGVFGLLHLWLAGMGMYCLSWQLTSNRLAAAFAGLAFAFSGLLLNSLMWPNNIATLGWMPWVIAVAEPAWREGGRRQFSLVILASLQVLSGGPEIILFTWCLVVARCVLRCREPGTRPLVRFRRLIAGIALVAGLTAVQSGPFLDLLAHSHRDRGYAGADWAMAGWGWVNLLVPLFRCFPVSGGIYLQTGQAWTSSYYVGVVTLALGVWGLVRRRSGEVRLLAAVFLLGLILAMGDAGYLYRGLREALPAMGLMRYPIKFVVLSVFAAPLLAAWGLACCPRSRGKGDKMALWSFMLTVGFLVLVMAGVLVYVGSAPPYGDTATWPVVWPHTAARIAFLGLTGVALVCIARWGGLWPRLAFLLLVWLDLVFHVPRQNPTVPPALLKPGWVRNEMAQASPPELGQGRVILYLSSQRDFGKLVFPDPGQQYKVARRVGDGNCNLLDRIPKVGGMFSLHLREMERVQGELKRSFDRLPNLLSYLAVSQVGVVRQTIEWLPSPAALPWVTLGQSPEFVDDESALRAVCSPAFAPKERVYLPTAAQGSGQVSNPGKADILRSRFEAERIKVEVEAPKGCYLVIAQAFYHPWKAQVDGAPAPLWRANYAFQATQVPPGKHTVVLRYEDNVLQIGLIVSVLTLMLVGVWDVQDRARRAPVPVGSDRVGPAAAVHAVRGLPPAPSSPKRTRHGRGR
jgi:hypothetical protein